MRLAIVVLTPFGAIDEYTGHSAKIADGDLHCDGDGALGLPRHVFGGPAEEESVAGVDAERGEEDANVLRAGAVGCCEDDVAWIGAGLVRRV